MHRIKSSIVSGFLFLALLAAISIYSNWVFFAPTRSPLLILSTSYLPPWDINPWEQENVATIESLGNHNLTSKQLKDVELLAKGQWSEFEDCVAQMNYSAPKGQPLLLYINLHGTVGQNDQPYLLVRNSVPLDSTTWIPMQDLLEHTAKILHNDRAVVLFMECGRHRDVLPRGVVGHSFAASVRKLIDQYSNSSRFKNLFVYLSTSTRLSSTDSPDGLADPFTMFLAKGLGGQCDHPKMGGNGNRQIETDELSQYVARQTKEFALARRGFYQTPISYSSGSSPIPIAWAGNASAKLAINTSYIGKDDLIAHVENAWKSIDSLREQAVWKQSPMLWASIIEHVIALEESAFSGAAGMEGFQDLRNRLQALFDSANRFNSVSPKRTQGLSTLDLDIQLAQQSQRLWSQVAQNPTWDFVSRTLQGMQQEQNSIESPVPFLENLRTNPQNGFWRNSTLVTRFAQGMIYLESARLLNNDLLNLNCRSQFERAAEEQRRLCEDCILANQIDESLLTKINRFAQTAEAALRENTAVSKCISEIALTVSELPIICRAMDSLDAIETKSEQGELANQAFEVIRKVSENLLCLKDRMQDAAGTNRSIKSIQPEMQRLHSDLSIRWRELIQRKKTLNPAENFAIQELLRSGFLATDGTTPSDAIALRIESRKHLMQTAMRSEAKELTQNQKPIDVPIANQQQVVKLVALLASELGIISATENGHVDDVGLEFLSKFVCDSTQSNPNKESYKDFVRSMVIRTLAPLSLDQEYSRVIHAVTNEERIRQLLYASNRTMDDFWRLPKDEFSPNANPYFHRVASTLLQQSASLCNGALDPNLEFARQLLQARLLASRGAIRMNAEQIPNWLTANSPYQSRCELALEPNGSGLPHGIASLGIVVDGENTIRGNRYPFAIGPDMRPQSLMVPLPTIQYEGGPNSKKCVAQVLYRGHQLAFDFEMVPEHQYVSVTRLEYNQPATIQVLDTRPKRRSRALILDCSASMVEPHVQESTPSSDVLRQSKLATAKVAITRLLDRWKNTSDDIGIVFFGHRVAQGASDQGNLMQQRYTSQFPVSSSLAAYEDVEIVLPVGRFSDSEYSRVCDRLELLLPWGQTPLFLAIYQTIQESILTGSQTPEDIIIISDGKNYQFNPSPEKNISLDNVIRVARDAGVRIHIIGFGIPNSELAEATNQYRRLAGETNGTVATDIADSLALIENIDRIFRPEDFAVQLANGDTQIGRCSEALTLPGITQPNTPIWVQYRGARQLVPANAGSALQLFANENERLVSARFQDYREIKRVPILNSNKEPSVFQLGIHEPSALDSGMRWMVSLQRTDGQVAQRPKRICIEVQPIFDPQDSEQKTLQQKASPFVVHNEGWRSNTPIPVLQFDTLHWPAAASKAKLRFWCTDFPTESSAEFSVPKPSTDSSATARDARSVKLESLNIQYRASWENSQTLVLAMRGEQVNNLGELVPQVLHAKPVKIDRQVEWGGNASVHRFLFDKVINGDVAIRIENVEAMKRIGLQLMSDVELNLVPEVAAHPRSQDPVVRR